jgi:hypothetical protein
MDREQERTAPPEFQADETAAAYVSALTVLKLGIDLLWEPSMWDPANPDAWALQELLKAAAARATSSGVALVERSRLLTGFVI